MLSLIKWSLSVALLGFLAVIVFAQQPGRDMEKEKAIWQQLEAVAPTAVETLTM